MQTQDFRIISGTWGEVWLEGEKVSEATGLQAKITYNKSDVNLCGQMGVGYKVTSYKGTGSLRMNKVSTRMGKLIGEKIRNGQDVRFTVISKLADPDSFGAERIVLKNVGFDDLTLADWEANSPGKVEAPFTFSDYEYLDMIAEG